MKTRFTSLNGAITLSALSLLAFVGYTLMEMRYFLEQWIPGDSAAMAETIVILLIVGGWLRALLVAASGRRGGWMALLAFSGFAILVALYDMQYVFSPSMSWPEQTMVFVMLGLALLAIAALGAQRRQRQTAG
jgi:TRAP-type C4-dicarboxylate transport system permease small subunit